MYTIILRKKIICLKLLYLKLFVYFWEKKEKEGDLQNIIIHTYMYVNLFSI